MTRDEAVIAHMNNTKVCAGAVDCDDYDEGYVLDVTGDIAEIGWNSGVRTKEPVAALRVAD